MSSSHQTVFLMHEDLWLCENGEWKNLSSFQDSVSFIGRLGDKLKNEFDSKMTHIIQIMKEFLMKHFDQWCNDNLPFALFSLPQTAQVVAKVILHKINNPQSSFTSLLSSHPQATASPNLFCSELQKGQQLI